MKVTSRDAIPPYGPLVVVANHDSFLDGFVLVAAFTRRRLTFLSASYLFEKPLTGAFLRAVGALPVQRGGGNFGSLRQAIVTLRRGGTVVVFPEGGILEDEVLGGAAYLALKADAPILPVHLKGTREALPPGNTIPSRSSIEVVVGSPHHLPRFPRGSAGASEAVAEGTKALERMLDQMRSGEVCAATLPLPLVRGDAR